MKKLSLIVGSMTVMVSSAAFAQISCTPTPSCAEMGYTQSSSSCVGDYLKCPYDTSKAFCVNCPDQCNELGFTKTATGGVYTCSEGQTVNKCKTNSTMYKCDGTACSYGYHLYSNLGPDPYGGKGCTQASTYGNTSCYEWRDNSSYIQYSEDIAQCQAAAYGYGGGSYDGPGYTKARTYTGGTYKDACGQTTYTYDFAYVPESSYGSSYCGYTDYNSMCCTRDNYGGGWQCQGNTPTCSEIYQMEQYGYYLYQLDGVSVPFSKYCYKKYNLRTYCGGMVFGDYYSKVEIPYNWDYNGWD